MPDRLLRISLLAFLFLVPLVGDAAPMTAQARRATEALLIAHRGASAYAPEHTLESYRLGIEQGADLIEPDLQITRDGVLVAVHDRTLERTTDVEAVYPDRARSEQGADGPVRRWYVVDFTLDELRRLDAGSWFDPAFSNARIPTFREVAELALEAGVGLIPETKAPEVYAEAGFDMVALLQAELAALGLDRAGGREDTPVVVQSFSPESLRELHDRGSDLRRILLVSRGMAPEWTSDEGLDAVAGFADGIGPAKGILRAEPSVADRARARGLLVTPYTFRESSSPGFDSVTAEMAWYLCEVGVDGLFTDNPDLFPRSPDCASVGRSPTAGP